MKRYTQSELRKMYMEPSAELKDCIHQEISSLPIKEQEEKIVKKKLSFSFVSIIAILIVLVAVAYAATEVYNRISINWKGETVEESEIVPQPTAEIPVPTEEADLHQIAERLVESAPEGEIVKASYPDPEGGQSGVRRSFCQKYTSWEELQQALSKNSGITLPAWIPDGYHLQYAEISFKSKNDYHLIEEKQEGSVTLRRYSVDDENKVIDDCYLLLQDDEKHTISITSTLSGSTDSNNSAINIPADNSVTSVTVPGMENAIAINSTGNIGSTLYLRRLLDSPIKWVDTPDMPAFVMAYNEEHIDIWATDLAIDELKKMFSLE